MKWLLLSVLLTAGLAIPAGGALSAQSGASESTSDVESSRALRIFFLSDAHSRHNHLERFIQEVERVRPDLILDGGDFVHDGTEAEFRRASAARARVGLPWHIAWGNHDAERRGPFSLPPPTPPRFRSFEQGGVRFILLDNHEEVLTDEQFRQLEVELEAHSEVPIVVVMHVPPVLSRSPLTAKLRHLLPFRLASPVMRDAEQVERFTALMERHRVLAVLSGHTHFADRVDRGGVQYIVAGALGGLTPGLGIANEYLDITIDGMQIGVQRISINDPPSNPVSFLAAAFRFYARLNGFNHAEQGWNYVPSASVQLKTGIRRTETASDTGVSMIGAASFERQLGQLGRHALFADLGLSVGSGELAGQAASGYKLRPIGTFNQNVFVSAAATTNAGVLASHWTAGVGIQLGLGLEVRKVSAEISNSWSTNHRAAQLSLGYRY